MVNFFFWHLMGMPKKKLNITTRTTYKNLLKKSDFSVKELILLTFPLEWCVKTLLIAENQLPFFPMSVALLFLPVRENEDTKDHGLCMLGLF